VKINPLAALTIASAASIAPTSPFVSTIPNAFAFAMFISSDYFLVFILSESL